jgi:hypothetical protein
MRRLTNHELAEWMNSFACETTILFVHTVHYFPGKVNATWLRL